ncbi:MAG: hypothetical protein ACYDAQ_09675 [Mycobacteriales bacterium]
MRLGRDQTGRSVVDSLAGQRAKRDAIGEGGVNEFPPRQWWRRGIGKAPGQGSDRLAHRDVRYLLR